MPPVALPAINSAWAGFQGPRQGRTRADQSTLKNLPGALHVRLAAAASTTMRSCAWRLGSALLHSPWGTSWRRSGPYATASAPTAFTPTRSIPSSGRGGLRRCHIKIQSSDSRLMSAHDPHAEERAFVATLPGWRRFLARLNWHSPLNDYLPGQGSTQPQKISARNSVKATLLLLLGAGIFAFLIWSQYLLIVMLLIPVVWVGAMLIFGLWRAIYDTLQEGESRQAKGRMG